MALKYEHESEYRYLVASDLSWRTVDIVQGYTLRWLVEVFLEDWKVYEGWGQLTKQPDEEGSSRSLVLSLLLDHCLLLHPQQLARLEHNLPACTVGSLRERTRVESLLECIRELILQDNPQEKLTRLSRAVEEVFQLRPSKKHLHNRDIWGGWSQRPLCNTGLQELLPVHKRLQHSQKLDHRVSTPGFSRRWKRERPERTL